MRAAHGSGRSHCTCTCFLSPSSDALVDHAAQVFRLLFLHDLRSAQNLSNELTSLAQEYTSDPKTDAKLGKVGV